MFACIYPPTCYSGCAMQEAPRAVVHFNASAGQQSVYDQVLVHNCTWESNIGGGLFSIQYDNVEYKSRGAEMYIGKTAGMEGEWARFFRAQPGMPPPHAESMTSSPQCLILQATVCSRKTQTTT